MMTNREAASHRNSSTTTSSSNSTHSSATIRPSPTPTPSAARGGANPVPYGVDGGLDTNRLSPHQQSLSSTTSRNNLQQSQPQPHLFGTTNRDRRSRDLVAHRRELATIETSRLPDIEQEPPTAGTTPLANQIAPWVTDDGPPQLPPAKLGASNFYNDIDDAQFLASQPPALNMSSLARNGNSYGFQEPPEPPYYNDGRRPSAASVATASSTGSKTSMSRGGGLRKLQGFFGEDFPGREGSDSTGSLPISVAGKDQPSRSYSHSRPSHRDRKASNATSIDQTRDASPSSSRPRTPVPAPEVVPFLYQDNSDIARYGEAPVRNSLTGPDRDRYVPENVSHNHSNASSSARSGHSIVHMPGHHHRHNRSNEDPKTLRPSISREESFASVHILPSRDKGPPTAMPPIKPRAQSPTPSATSGLSQGISRTGSGHTDGQASPGTHGKLGLLNRFRRHHKEKEEPSGGSGRSRNLTQSAKSSQAKGSKADIGRRDQSPAPRPTGTSVSLDIDAPDAPRNVSRGTTFNNKFPFSKKTRAQKPQELVEEEVGPTERTDPSMKNVWHLDTNLNDMEGILTRPPALPLMDAGFPAAAGPEQRESLASPIPKGHWDAPDSWAVRRNTEDNTYEAPEIDDLQSPPRGDEKLTPYCIRIFRSDGTFSTHSMSLDATVTDVISQVIKKAYVVDGLDNYHIILKKQGLIRVLSPLERPLFIQKRMLEQVGYEEKDRIEDLGREDNTYLCRFMFLSAKESDFHSKTADMSITRTSKQNYVDLSGRNLITIPISLYSKASDIISLNLSRNLSLDVPRDFIQSCKHLRDIKFNNNEARRLPPSLCRANKLTYLDVSNNKVEQLEHAELDSLVGLLKMNLANNRLKQLPSYFGAYLSLRSLNISSNFLEKFPQFLCDLPSLVDLDLSFNAISSLPEEIGNLKSLEKLLITNNRLSHRVPDTFRDLSSLRELDIKYNGITSIDIISDLPKLEILYADHNSISAFTGRFERLRQLKLNSNPLNRFEIEEPLPTLKTLNLSNAQLASIDSTFVQVFNLEHLILDKNYFVSLPPQIGTLLKLEHFSIANNSVGELPSQIGCLTELRVLNVRGNNISKLPMEIWWARKLETFNASSNVLDNFPKPASRAPRVPGEDQSGAPPLSNGKGHPLGTPSASESFEELPEERRPSQASSTLLSVGPSPVSDRKSSIVSVYGKGGRKTSVVSRTTSQGTVATNATHTTTTARKDSGLSSKLTNTFAGSLRNLYLADNRLDDDVFDQITLCAELRVLNLSYNYEIGDMPQRSIKSWPQLVELYLSGNGLTTLPADDLEDASLLQALYINGNKFTNLPADISRAKKLAVLDCGSNSLKYNISNVPYDWNWNLNPNLRYLNLSGNKKLEIKKAAGSSQPGISGSSNADLEQYTDFSRLQNLRVLGLMDVTLKQPSIPDQSEDRRVRTSGSLAGHLPYGMADTLGKNEHLSTVDLVVPRFNSSETEMLLGLFDGQALSSGGSKIAKYLHENFGHVFAQELNALKVRHNETPSDALRRAFLAVNKDLATVSTSHTAEDRPRPTHRGSSQPLVLSKEDLNSGGVATVVYLQGIELYVANVGDAQALIIQTDGTHKILTRKHDPADPTERARIREAGGWVSRNGRLNDTLDVSRAFGYCDLMPITQSAPHVSNMTIREQDDIILLATKELWDYLSPGLVTDIARAERADPMRAAQKLRDLAMAYGATGKIMVMMISVADLKRRVERSKLNRGASMSLYPSGVPEEAQGVPRRLRKTNRDILDSSLNRLEAEIPPPTGTVSIVFTDIKNSTTLWELYPNAMRSAIKLHNEVMRRQLRRIGGYEVKTEGDAFMVSFPTAISALLWCFAVQLSLLEVAWPSEVLNAVSAQLITDKDDTVIFKGLSVRMGIHYGDCVSEVDPVTRRMDYFGPMVNKASRISAVADGGQIAVSYDFITEIQRCLENYQDTDRNASSASDEAFDEEAFTNSIRKDLRSLTSQGFDVKEMGEKKLKGLENPELVYSLYPQALAGRIDYHTQLDRPEEAATRDEQPATLRSGTAMDFTPDMIWDLWKVSLRLEMLCSTLEEVRGPGLQPPETQLMERIKARGGEVTERFLLNFMEHQVSRIETCVSTLTMRYLAIGGGTLRELNQLRAPMSQIFEIFTQQQRELERYRTKFGPLPDSDEDAGDDQQPNGLGSSVTAPTSRRLMTP